MQQRRHPGVTPDDLVVPGLEHDPEQGEPAAGVDVDAGRERDRGQVLPGQLEGRALGVVPAEPVPADHDPPLAQHDRQADQHREPDQRERGPHHEHHDVRPGRRLPAVRGERRVHRAAAEEARQQAADHRLASGPAADVEDGRCAG
jgi:hypothetical protein